MLTSEQVFDMLPNVVDIYDKLNLDAYIKSKRKENKGKKVDATEVGISAFKHVLKNSGKVKNEVFQIVAIAESKSVEEVKDQPFIKTFNTLKNVFSDKEAVDFFKQAMPSVGTKTP